MSTFDHAKYTHIAGELRNGLLDREEPHSPRVEARGSKVRTRPAVPRENLIITTSCADVSFQRNIRLRSLSNDKLQRKVGFRPAAVGKFPSARFPGGTTAMGQVRPNSATIGNVRSDRKRSLCANALSGGVSPGAATKRYALLRPRGPLAIAPWAGPCEDAEIKSPAFPRVRETGRVRSRARIH